MTVAQLVEPRIVIPVVVGSSPISHPKFPSILYGGFFLPIFFLSLSGYALLLAQSTIYLFPPLKKTLSFNT